MKGFKQCDQGHFYKETLSSCNYCGEDNEGTKKDLSDTVDQHTVPVTNLNATLLQLKEAQIMIEPKFTMVQINHTQKLILEKLTLLIKIQISILM